jgi:flagellar hook-basal body complex protein FliE
MDYSSAITRALPGTFVPDIPDETPNTSAIPGGADSGVAGAAPTDDSGKTFIETLKELAGDVNTKMITSEQNTQDLATGKTNDLSKVVTSVEEANLAFQFALAVRTKLLTAYQAVQQMQV